MVKYFKRKKKDVILNMSEQDWEFNDDLDDFAMEEALDAYVDSLLEPIGVTREGFIKASEQTMFLNPNRLREFALVYKTLKETFNESDTVVIYEMGGLLIKNMGAVRVIGKNILFPNPKVFMIAIRLTSNFEAYPKVDGTVQMNFTFYGLANSIKAEMEDL